MDLFAYQSLLGFRVAAWEDDRITLRIEVDDRHLGDTGEVSHGVIASLLDAATALAACHCTHPGRVRRTVTLSLATNFLNPTRGPVIDAHGEVIHRDGALVVSEGRVTDSAGTLVAVANTHLRHIVGGGPEGHPETDLPALPA